eukprot:s1258_g16.t3
MHTRPRALRRCRACQHEFMVLQSNFKHTRNSSHTFHIGFRVKYRLGAPKEAWLIDALHAPTHERHGRTAGKPFRSMRKAAQLAALNAAASAGDVAAARRCFEALQPRDRARTVAWNTMLKAHAIAGDLNGATEHFRAGSGKCWGCVFATDSQKASTAELLESSSGQLQRQRSRSRGHGLEVDVVAYTTVADAFSKAGRPDEAEAFLLRANAQQGLALDSVAMGALSAGFAKLGQAEKAQHWLEEMIRQGLEPSPESVGAVAAAWAQRGKPLHAEMCLREMSGRHLEPSPSMVTSLVHGCSKAGQTKAGAAFVEQLQKEGTTPTVEVYNAMLSGCARLGKTREAEAKFREMLDASLQPDVITFNSMKLAFRT